MKIFLIRHGKSNKSLQDKLSHEEFELKRPLVDGEEEKAEQLGKTLKKRLGSVAGYDFVFSGKERSKQTALAIASGLGLSKEEALANLREDLGLSYLTTQKYWHSCETAIKNGGVATHADYFLQNPPDDPKTFSAEYMRQNMRSVIKRAIERNTLSGKNVSMMVSHEPVISLCLSDLTGKSVTQLGGSCNELEYAEFVVISPEKLDLTYRDKNYAVGL